MHMGCHSLLKIWRKLGKPECGGLTVANHRCGLEPIGGESVVSRRCSIPPEAWRVSRAFAHAELGPSYDEKV
jgi:hypothetical protein